MNQEETVFIIIKAINSILSSLFSSIDVNIYEKLDSITFIDSSIINSSSIQKLLGNNGKTGLIYLCDAMLLGIFIFYIVKYFYSNIVDYNIEKPVQFIFKLFCFALLVNFSYFFMEQLLNLTFLLSSSIQAIGKEILHLDISFSQLITVLNKKVLYSSNESINFFSFDGFIKSFSTFGLIDLLLNYSLRYVLIQVIILLSPFGILSLISSSTSWLFKAWFKTLFSLLSIQFFVPIVIIVIFCIGNDNQILFVCGIYILTKINSYVREMFGGLSTEFSGNVSNVFSFLKK